MGTRRRRRSPTGEQPNWVTQLSTPATGSTTAEFTVPVGANEAAVGATTANLASQGASIAPFTGNLNDIVVMMGENDAVALAKGLHNLGRD